MTPVIYHTVVLLTRHQINAFSHALLAPSRPHRVGTDTAAQPLGSYVRCLWFGPNDLPQTNTLDSSRMSVWPVESIRAILPRCPSLRALAICNFPEELWAAVGAHIPASVSALHLGAVRAYMQWDWAAFPCFANLRAVTSMEVAGVWAPRMYKALATAPRMRVLRRIFPPRLRDTHRTALQRAAAVEYAEGLDRVEIIGCLFTRPELVSAWLERCMEVAGSRVDREGPGRFVLRTVDGGVAWKVLFDDWTDFCARA